MVKFHHYSQFSVNTNPLAFVCEVRDRVSLVILRTNICFCFLFLHVWTHCGLVMPYGFIKLDQHWFRLWLLAWCHQVITWTNVLISEVLWHSLKGIHLIHRKCSTHLLLISVWKLMVNELSNIMVDWIMLKRGSTVILFMRLYHQIDGLVQKRRYSIAIALVLHLSCTNPMIYHQVSNIRCTLVGSWIVDHSDVVGASPVSAAPTTSSLST